MSNRDEDSPYLRYLVLAPPKNRATSYSSFSTTSHYILSRSNLWMTLLIKMVFGTYCDILRKLIGDDFEANNHSSLNVILNDAQMLGLNGQIQPT